MAMRLLISERAAITQAAEVVVAVPAHVRVPVPEAGEPDARKRFLRNKAYDNGNPRGVERHRT